MKKREDEKGLTRREFLYLTGAGVAGATLASTLELGHGAEEKRKYGGRLRVGERYGCTGLDAHKNQFFMDFQNYVLMYNALTIMGPLPQVRIYPDLAKSWEISPDGKEYVFSLWEGVKFHHGKELDSGDVKYSIERVMNLTFSDNTYVDGCNAAVGQLKKIGIESTIKVIDRAPFFESMRKGEYSIGFRGDSERLDPDDAYYLWLHSGEIGKNNWSRYRKMELDDLLEKGRTAWKWEERMPLYQKVIEIVRDDLPLLYLAKSIIPLAYRDHVKGFGAGMATWFGYHGGGFVKTWMDK